MGDGGTQRQKSILSKELSRSFDLTMALFKDVQLHHFHGKIILLNSPTSKNPFILAVNIIKRIMRLIKLMKDSSYDIIISSSVVPNFFTLLVKRFFRIRTPLVITFNNANRLNAENMGIPGILLPYLNRKLSGSADCIVPVSKALGNELIEEGYDKSKVYPVYNGIDFDDILKKADEKIEEAHEAVFKRKSLKIVAVGRLSVQKNYSLLIKAFSIICSRIDAELIILGDGELRSRINNEISQYGLTEKVHLFGFVSNPYKYMKASDIFALSSLWEGFPNVLLEAMACGIPVVSTGCHSGPNEIIESGENGILVPVNDHERFAEEIVRLAHNNALYNSIRENGKRKIRQFDIRNITHEWEKIINRLTHSAISDPPPISESCEIFPQSVLDSRIFALIVTYADRGRYVEKLADHLFSIGIAKIVIIDNNSIEESARILDSVKSKYGERILLKHYRLNAGTAIAFKDAMQTAAADPCCEYIWILDDDNIPDPGALDELLRVWKIAPVEAKNSMLMLASFRKSKQVYLKAICCEKPNIIIGEPNYFRAFHLAKIHTMITRKLKNPDIQIETVPEFGEISAAPYGGMFFNKEMIRSIGLPDERFYIYSEDHEFSHRLVLKGGKILLCTASTITDIEDSWNARGMGIFNIAQHPNKTLLYYSIRNRVKLELKITVNNYITYFANAAIYTFAVFLSAVFSLKLCNFIAFFRGLLDGLTGKKGIHPKYRL
jgi:glycosyltransferase involved in cell wall biosynthesis/GT2 family glycosyltransferase